VVSPSNPPAAPPAFLALAGRRRSVRRYTAQPVERAQIDRCLEAARLAPSACNAQPWTFIVVDDPALRDSIAAATSGGVLPLNHFTRQAPVLVVAVQEPANPTSRIGAAVKNKPFAFMDVGIAAEHFCLQAAEEGLGACMLGWFDEARVRTLLGIPAPARPVLILTLGHPDGPPPPPRPRKALAAMSAWNAHPAAPAGGRAPRRGVGGLVLWLGLTYAAAAVGGAASARAGAFYAELAQPAWAPPGWLFGPVWSLLYTLMGVAAWLVWRERGFRAARGALTLYLAQLALNALWTWLFFAWRLGALAVLGNHPAVGAGRRHPPRVPPHPPARRPAPVALSRLGHLRRRPGRVALADEPEPALNRTVRRFRRILKWPWISLPHG
jgi:nitroreductase